MNIFNRSTVIFIVLTSLISACSDEAKNKAMAEKYNAVQAEKIKHKAMSAEEMSAHSGEEIHHATPMANETTTTPKIDTDEIGRRADDLPPPLTRRQSQRVSIDLYSDEVVAEMMPDVTYQIGRAHV